MGPRASWAIAGVVAAGGGLLVLAGWGGTLGFPDLLFPVLLSGGAAFPFVAAFVLGREAILDPARRVPLAALLAAAAASVAALAWWGRGGTPHFLLTLLGGAGVGVLGVAALVADRTFRPDRPGRRWLRGAARWSWMAVLAGGVLYLALPFGVILQRRDIARAKAWVERAAAEVRAAEGAGAGPPADLEALLPRLGRRPRLVPEDGGYSLSRDGGWSFTIEDPSGFLSGWWIYEGKSGTWVQEDF